MNPKTRLDAVVRIREVDEDRAKLTLAEAQRLARDAAAAVRSAAARAHVDERRGGTAADWAIVESAHIRALQDARQAEHDERAAAEKLGASRAHYVGARTRAEALRRVLEARRSEMRVAERSAERKAMDEVATLLYGRRW